MILSFLAGCEGNPHGPLGSVTGTVTIGDETAPQGTKVLFMGPESGHAGYAITDQQGQYKVEWRKSGKTYSGLPLGKYQIMVIPSGIDDADQKSAEEMLAGDSPKAKKAPKLIIPAKYMRANTSGLEFTIENGDNKYDIDIKP